MPEFIYSAEARRDLFQIWEHIAQNDIDAADRVEKEIELAIVNISKNPRIGHLRRDITKSRSAFGQSTRI
jgi:plasmid stabilization system protein ParE